MLLSLSRSAVPAREGSKRRLLGAYLATRKKCKSFAATKVSTANGNRFNQSPSRILIYIEILYKFRHSTVILLIILLKCAIKLPKVVLVKYLQLSKILA